MSASRISDFRDVVRVLIGDDDFEGLYEYEDSQVDAAIRMVFQFGRQPEGYVLGSDDTITPAVTFGDHFAGIALRAARTRLGGAEGGLTYRTRAISVGRADRGDDKWGLMRELEQRLYEIEGVVAFATQRDFITWVNDMNGAYTERDLVWNGLTYSLSADVTT